MTRYIVSLLIALIVYVSLIILFISVNFTQHKIKQKSSNKIKISMKTLQIKKSKKINQKKLIKKKSIKKKKITKKKILKKKQKNIIKKNIYINKTLNINPKKKIKQVKKKEILQKQITKPDDPMAWLYEDMSQQQTETTTKQQNQNSINQNVKELYGSKFDTLSKAQQNYILDNQEIMRRITQRVLNRVASVNLKGNINVNTSNIVEFYLHPNGDMTDFKFLEKSGYFILDDTTRETIEYAYSQYPRPKEKTLIRYNVFYNLIH